MKKLVALSLALLASFALAGAISVAAPVTAPTAATVRAGHAYNLDPKPSHAAVIVAVRQPASIVRHTARVKTAFKRVAIAVKQVAPVATPSAAPTPWNPPLVICPSPVNGINGEWISLASPPICELEHVYGFVAPPGWKLGDPIPPWQPAP